MESGTLLHLALLRKISNANKNKRQKPVLHISTHKHQNYSNKKSILHLHANNGSTKKCGEAPDQNYTLCGWSTQQNQFKQQLKLAELKNKINNHSKYDISDNANSIVKLEKLRQSFQQKHKNVYTSRNNLKTSQNCKRIRNRSHSFRNYLQYKSVNSTKLSNQNVPSNPTSNHCNSVYRFQNKLKFHQNSNTYLPNYSKNSVQNISGSSNRKEKQYKLRQITSQIYMKTDRDTNKYNIMYTDKDAVKRVPYDDKSTDRDRDSCIYRKHSQQLEVEQLEQHKQKQKQNEQVSKTHKMGEKMKVKCHKLNVNKKFSYPNPNHLIVGSGSVEKIQENNTIHTNMQPDLCIDTNEGSSQKSSKIPEQKNNYLFINMRNVNNVRGRKFFKN